ncbi:hypothetical protein, partial [Rhodopirellula bahusiensis]
DIPPWAKPVSITHWRDELIRCGVLDHEAKNPRSAFKRLKDGLTAAREIVERDGLVWPVQLGAMTHAPPLPAARESIGSLLPPLPPSPVPRPPP